MKALGYSIWLQCKLDVRNKNVLTAYYILPIAFYLLIGAIYKEINPMAEETLIQSMSVLAISIAAFLGTPAPLVNFFTSDTKKTYIVGNIRLSVILLTTFLSAVVHMLVVSLMILLSAPMIFGASRPAEIGVYFGWILVTIIISTIIGMTIGIAAKSNSSMTTISQLIFLPTMLLCGIMLPMSILPDILQKAGKIFPATYLVEILMTTGDITSDMLVPLVGIGIIGIIALVTVYKKALIR